MQGPDSSILSLNSSLDAGEPEPVVERGNDGPQWGQWDTNGKPLSPSLSGILVAWITMVASRVERSCLSPF